MKYIVGNNNVSWLLLHLLEDSKLVLHKTLERFDFNAGQPIIQPSLTTLVKEHFENVSTKEFERFYDDRGNFTSIKPKNFEKLYSLYTRGKTTTEKSYEENYIKYVKYVSIDNLGPEESYDLLFEKIKDLNKDRTIDGPIESIDPNGTICLNKQEIPFDRLLSTINLVDLVEIDSSKKIRDFIIDNNKLEGFNLPYNDKFIYICKLESEEDKTLSNIYKQVLVTGKAYFRKTYIKDKIIIESMRNIYDDQIEGNSVEKYIESTQISDNLNINKVLGIDLVGRFSEWSENITLETIYDRAYELKEFYSFNENNHKKVL